MTGFELVADLTSLRGELAARLVAQWSAVGGLSDLAATATIAIPPAALEACDQRTGQLEDSSLLQSRPVSGTPS